MTSPRSLPFLLAVSLLTGCVGAMELGRAETLPRGRFEVATAIGASVFVEPRRLPAGDATGGAVILLPLLPFDLAVSYGATDRLQLDARVGTLSAQLGVKAGLVRSPAVSLALAGRVSAEVYGRGLSDPSLRSRLALLAGRRLGRRFEVDLAPQCSWPLDPARWKPELLGATATVYLLPGEASGTRIGVAVSWQHYAAPHPEPGDVTAADYVGGALILSRAPPDP